MPSTILSDNGVTSGTAGIKTTGSNDGQLALQTTTAGGTATTALTIDTSQNVGVGTSTPSYRFSVGGQTSALSGAGIELFRSGGLSSSVGGVLNFRPSLGTAVTDIYNLSILAYDHSGDSNADGLSINAQDGISFCTGSNSRQERARLDSSGKVLINETTRWRGNGILSITTGADDGVAVLTGSAGLIVRKTSYTNAYLCLWENNGGSIIGSITTGGSTTAYNTSSDYRLKENIAPMTGALEKIAQLNPVTYTWKTDGSAGQGFIAHELQAVVPDCVTGEKDAVETVEIKDDDGNVTGTEERPVYQGIDTSFLVATLTAAIQEQQAMIQELKAELDATKAQVAALQAKV